MIGGLDSIDALAGLLAAVLIFGFCPRLALRLIIRVYPENHPTRRELLGELDAVPRSDRPFWVAEQLEVALFDGLPSRYRQRRAAKSQDASHKQSSRPVVEIDLSGHPNDIDALRVFLEPVHVTAVGRVEVSGKAVGRVESRTDVDE